MLALVCKLNAFCLSYALLQENYEILSRCIKENLGFKVGKPVAACVIYRCLVHWHSFESERTAIFDFIIEGINDVLKVIFSFCSFYSFCLLNLAALSDGSG